MCWRRQGGLLVGRDVSVCFGLIGGGGVGGVGDRGEAVRQGSCNKAFDHCSRSCETPCCCNIDQTWRKSETHISKIKSSKSCRFNFEK